MAVAYQPLL